MSVQQGKFNVGIDKKKGSNLMNKEQLYYFVSFLSKFHIFSK